ncbi:hypothetical protein SNE510_70900 [Streptomyces sp. NE5-10]|nr:hypothetical protein SNE510_70900 [Streptomyces sp. NE5-10]
MEVTRDGSALGGAGGEAAGQPALRDGVEGEGGDHGEHEVGEDQCEVGRVPALELPDADGDRPPCRIAEHQWDVNASFSSEVVWIATFG